MTRANTAGDRAAARERTRLEAETLTGLSGLSQRVSDAVVRAHRNGADYLAVLPESLRARVATGAATTAPAQLADHGAPIPPEHANYRIPPIRHLTADLQPLAVNGTRMTPIGVLLGGVSDFKILRGQVASVNLTTSTEFRHLLADAAVISRGNLLVCALYEIPRGAVFADDDTAKGVRPGTENA